MPETAAAPGSLAAALVQLQAALPRIVKDTPGQYGKYANLASIHALVLPLLAPLGLYWVCMPTLNADGQFVLAYCLSHVDQGSPLTGEYPLGTGTAQQLGSAITYARRYTLCAVLGLVADEDDDGQAATAEWKPPAHPHTRKADRHSAKRSGPLPDDDWTTSPPEEAPGSVSGARLTELHIWFTRRGITDRDDRLAYTMSALDLPELGSSKDLSESQALALIKHLKEDARA